MPRILHEFITPQTQYFRSDVWGHNFVPVICMKQIRIRLQAPGASHGYDYVWIARPSKKVFLETPVGIDAMLIAYYSLVTALRATLKIASQYM